MIVSVSDEEIPVIYHLFSWISYCIYVMWISQKRILILYLFWSTTSCRNPSCMLIYLTYRRILHILKTIFQLKFFFLVLISHDWVDDPTPFYEYLRFYICKTPIYGLLFQTEKIQIFIFNIVLNFLVVFVILFFYFVSSSVKLELIIVWTSQSCAIKWSDLRRMLTIVAGIY